MTAYREARPDEAGALTRIAFASKRHWGYPGSWIDLWSAELTLTADYIASHRVIVAVRDGVAVALCSLEGSPPEGSLEHFWVEPAAMGQGVGRGLFRQAVAEAAARGMERLPIVADPHAEGFYRKMGARPAGHVPSVPEGRLLPVLVAAVPPPSSPGSPSGSALDTPAS